MGLFTQNFLAERREDFLSLIDRFEYEVDNGEQWLTAVERSRQIVGNYIRITLLLPNVLQREYNITAIRIIDVNGNVIGQSDLKINVNSIQTIYMYSAFLIRRYKNGRRNKTAKQRVYLPKTNVGRPLR